MPQINLLPWREQAKKAKKIRVALYLAGFICLTLLFVLILHIYYDILIYNQESRNDFLQSEMTEEGAQLLALKKKKEKQTAIISELRFVISLREKSYSAVNLLDELVRVVPEGVSFNKIIRNGNNIVILGKAQSEVQITLFMKNITKSVVFKQPVLTQISSKENVSGNETYFQLKIEQQELINK